MQLLISDANILIDVEVGGLLEAMLRLEHRFAVPDILYAEELSAHHPDLPDRGLEVLELAEEAIADAVGLLERHADKGVSRNDIFALALARQERRPLLTGDHALRMASEEENAEVYGTVWLVEEMVRAGLIDVDTARDAYAAMRAGGRRLPWAAACLGPTLSGGWRA